MNIGSMNRTIAGSRTRTGQSRIRACSGQAASLLGAALVALLLVAGNAQAQTQFMILENQNVSPAFEGWWPNEEEGGYTLFFGYMNSNWEEEFDIPVGPRNYFTFTGPGELDDLEVEAYDESQADQGQPTHFYPRRNPFLFTVDVPEDFGEQELVWTLTTHGDTRRAYASLKPDYRIDPQVISTEVGGDYGSLADALRTNIPPDLAVEGADRRTVRVGEPLTLVAYADDPDDLPDRRPVRNPRTPEQLYNPPGSVVAISGPGLRLSWIVYRGERNGVSFDPVQMKTWTDTRVWGNSPWSPPWNIPEPPENGRYEVDVVFDEPGTYVLRAIASDGSLFTNRNITVTVTDSEGVAGP
ncbi:MAG: hypothetical protein R3223_01670 [Longimicrobiales bacterium]|nr:hypothetical protein [Longimicrobiales bacterium]